MPANVRDQFLIHRIRANKDRSAFDELARHYQAALYRLLRSKLPTEQDAEDALTTTLLRTWNYLTRSNDVEHVGGLVFTIGRGVISEFYRHRKETVSLDSMADAGVDLPSGRHGEPSIRAAADLRLLTEMMDHLDGEERTLVLLRHVEGFSIKEVADKVGKTAGATKVAIYRATKKLRNLFEPKV